MATTGHKNRSIKRLHLDLRNPRLGRPSVDTEAEAMTRLLKEFGPKIVGLARSIAEHGLNPPSPGRSSKKTASMSSWKATAASSPAGSSTTPTRPLTRRQLRPSSASNEESAPQAPT